MKELNDSLRAVVETISTVNDKAAGSKKRRNRKTGGQEQKTEPGAGQRHS